MERVLIAGETEPLAGGAVACAGFSPTPVPAHLRDGVLVVDETLPERLRASLTRLSVGTRPVRIVLAPVGGVDPLGPDPYLQSATFLTAAAALEAGVGVGLLTRGVPAKGFGALFSRYPGRIVAHVAFGPEALEHGGAPSWSARLGTIAALSAAGVPTWLRIDPAVPGQTDGADVLERWLAGAAAAGACGVVVAPLVLDDAARAALADDPTVVDYYRPGRRRRRGVLPVPPAAYLPLERETALMWRVRRVAQDHSLPTRLCRCARTGHGACGLAGSPRPAMDEPRLPLLPAEA